MKTIFGVKGLALTEYAIAANAILGIRDSGKTYTATEASEELFEAGIPFIWLDPIGVAHNLRIPGKGKGYPVVVAGGKFGDLPLTTKNVGAIVRAAMESGVSLVLDLFSVELSKADWRRIVKETCEILLHENAEFGLRHVFIEEAAEFVPQRPQDMQVFSAVEKLVRMGGNSKVGITLINQRSADLNKSVLELCANVFVHRQRGKNTLQDLKKWLSMTDPDTEKKITASLPDLNSGQCWVMSNDLKTPVLIKVPEKNSLHPDRRAAPINTMDLKKHQPVPADDFVAKMKAALAPKEKPVGVIAKPAGKRVEIVHAGTVVIHPDEIQRVTTKAFNDGRALGFYEGEKSAAAELSDKFVAARDAFESARAALDAAAPKMDALDRAMTAIDNRKPKKGTFPQPPPPPKVSGNSPSRPPVSPSKPPRGATAPVEGLSKPQAKILESLAWWKRLGHDSPTRVQVGIKAKMKARGGHFKTRVSELSGMGMVAYDGKDRMLLTPNGLAAAPEPDIEERVVQSLRPLLSAPQGKILDAMLAGNTSRTDIAEAAGMDAAGGHFKTRLSELSSFGIIDYPDKASATLQDWVQE